MKNILKTEIQKLVNSKQVNKAALEKMLTQLDKEENLTRPQNPQDHFCAFFLPIHKKSKSIYLGDHIKAGSWIPPGGHIELNEHPIETVIREFQEELKYRPDKKDIQLFDLSIVKIINNPRSGACRTHFDIWYIVEMKEKINFDFDPGEYKTAKWFSLEDGVQKVTDLTYNKIIKKLNDEKIFHW